MGFLQHFGAIKVGYCPSYAQNSVIAACGQAKAFGNLGQMGLTLCIWRGAFLKCGTGKVGIASIWGALEPAHL